MGGEAQERQAGHSHCGHRLAAGARSFCYLFEYFAANYFLNSGYTMQSAVGSAAPIGDMMVVVGDALFGPGARANVHAGRGRHGVPGTDRHHAFLH